MTMGEFKQTILKINNSVNQKVFNQGLLSQRVDVIRNEVIITAVNRRISVLNVSYAMDRSSTEIVDRVLILRFKELFAQEVKRVLGLKIVSHLKDYDPDTEMSVSVTVFERPVEELLPDLKVLEQ